MDFFHMAPWCSWWLTLFLPALHVGIFQGGGVKNWSNLLADNSKKLPMGGGKGSKNIKICQRPKWMVP